MGLFPHLFHKWRTAWGTGKHRYDECAICGQRRVVKLHEGGDQAIDLAWLSGAAAERGALGDPDPIAMELPDFGGDDKPRGKPG